MERPGSRDWVRSGGRQVQEAAHMYARMCIRMYVCMYVCVPAQRGERQEEIDGDGKKEIDR